MENDGYTLDSKRNPIDGSDIPDIINRFNNLDKEKNRTRKDKSFMVPVDEIIKNNYYLGINKYRTIEIPTNVYEDPKNIYKEIEKLEKEYNAELKKLGGYIL